jgi:hypothetical protein
LPANFPAWQAIRAARTAACNKTQKTPAKNSCLQKSKKNSLPTKNEYEQGPKKLAARYQPYSQAAKDIIAFLKKANQPKNQHSYAIGQKKQPKKCLNRSID